MRKLFPIICLFFFGMGCNKDSMQSKPILKINSISTNKIAVGEDLEIKIQLTDLEGDFLDTIWVKKTTTRCAKSNFIDSNFFRIPNDLPRTKNFSGELKMNMNYNIILQPRCFVSDSAIFSFWIKDEKGNKSDTVKTSQIIILR